MIPALAQLAVALGCVVTAAAVAYVVRLRQFTGLWRHAPRASATITATVVRPVPSSRPLPGGQAELSPGQRIIRGELER
jgi:hypothetical protein